MSFTNRFRLLFLNEDFKSLDKSVISVIIPNVATGFSIQQTPVKDIYLPGDSLEISELSVGFQLDEDYGNWITIMNWINNNKNFRNTKVEELKFSDISIQLGNKKKNMIYNVELEDCFPINISSIDFSTRSSDIDPLEFTVDFKVNNMDWV